MFKDLSTKYYHENKERLEKTCERYQNLSEEEHKKKATVWLQTLQKSLRR